MRVIGWRNPASRREIEYKQLTNNFSCGQPARIRAGLSKSILARRSRPSATCTAAAPCSAPPPGARACASCSAAEAWCTGHCRHGSPISGPASPPTTTATPKPPAAGWRKTPLGSPEGDGEGFETRMHTDFARMNTDRHHSCPSVSQNTLTDVEGRPITAPAARRRAGRLRLPGCSGHPGRAGSGRRPAWRGPWRCGGRRAGRAWPPPPPSATAGTA